MKNKFLKHIIFTAFLIMLLIAPFVYLLIQGEYDKEQLYVPQEFMESEYQSYDLSQVSLMQKFISTDDRLTGVDLVGENLKYWQDEKVELLDENRNHITFVKVDQLLFVNKREVLNLRFEKINNSEGQTYYIKFHKNKDSKIKLTASIDSYYEKGQLFVDNDKKDGNLNMNPVYKASSWKQYWRVFEERFTYLFSASFE